MSKSPPVRPVVYPRLSVAVCGAPEKSGIPPDLAASVAVALASVGAEGLFSSNPPMSHLDARALMGWDVEEEGGEKFGDDFLLVDHYGRKVRCPNNVRNRPYYKSNAEDRAQDILNRRWELNGETIVVSREADVLDGQHTCGGLVRAYERWLLDRDAVTGERIWLKEWPEDEYPDGPVIDKIVVYGISSADAVVNTMNTGKPRTLADVLYRSPYFASLPAKGGKSGINRVTAGKVTAAAISHVWFRTGVYLSNFSPLRTTAEAVVWLEAHGGQKGKFLACVRHVLEADRDGRVSALVPLGYAASVMWMMACSDTSDDKIAKYYSDEDRTAKRLDFSLWNEAVEFWSEFGRTKELKDGEETAEPTGKLAELTLAVRAIAKRSDDSSNAALERNYVVTRAWNRFRTGDKVTDEDVRVKYTRADRYGVRHLDTNPDLGGRLLGGIDLGTERVNVVEQVEAKNGIHEAEAAHGKRRVDPPVTGIAADGVEHFVASVVAAEKVDVVLVRTASGGYAVWGDAQCALVVPHATKRPRMHPKGLVQIAFRADEADQLADLLTDAGTSVAFVAEAIAPVNGDARYDIERVLRPRAVKGGK